MTRQANLRDLEKRILDARRRLADLEREHRARGGDTLAGALGPTWVIVDFIERTRAPVRPADVARALHLDSKIVRTLLGNLAVAGRIARPSLGLYAKRQRGDVPAKRRAPYPRNNLTKRVLAYFETHPGSHMIADVHRGVAPDTDRKLIGRLLAKL